MSLPRGLLGFGTLELWVLGGGGFLRVLAFGCLGFWDLCFFWILGGLLAFAGGFRVLEVRGL